MKVKVIDSIKLLVELISPSGDEISTGDVQWHVNTLREDNHQLQVELANARRRLHAHEDTNDELRANLGVPAGTSLREYAKLIDAPRLNALEEKYKALVADMASVRRLTNAADNVGTVDQVRAVMDREILAQARERQLITDKLELSKSVRRYKSEYADLLAKWTQLDERCAALTNEVAELYRSKLSIAAAFDALERDKLLADASAERAKASAEEAAELAERWEGKSKELCAALEAERGTVASLLEDRCLLHEANKKILALTGASLHETPVMAVERLAEAYKDIVGG